jgi:hypothetical protein
MKAGGLPRCSIKEIGSSKSAPWGLLAWTQENESLHLSLSKQGKKEAGEKRGWSVSIYSA